MRHLRSAVVGLGALLALLLTACGATPPPQPEPNSPGAPTTGAKAAEATAASADQTAYRIVVGDTVLTGHLFDNAAARDLAAQLPLTVTFRDLNSVEKTTPLPRKLAVDGMPAGADPQVGDLGYWAPDGDLVIYYGDVGYWTGTRSSVAGGVVDAMRCQTLPNRCVMREASAPTRARAVRCGSVSSRRSAPSSPDERWRARPR